MKKCIISALCGAVITGIVYKVYKNKKSKADTNRSHSPFERSRATAEGPRQTHVRNQKRHRTYYPLFGTEVGSTAVGAEENKYSTAMGYSGIQGDNEKDNLKMPGFIRDALNRADKSSEEPIDLTNSNIRGTVNKPEINVQEVTDDEDDDVCTYEGAETI